MKDQPTDSTPPGNPAAGEGSSPIQIDADSLNQAKEILTLMAHTHSAMKLFPEHHSTVINFQNDLFKKMDKYISGHNGMEIEVKENSFLVGGEPAFVDENIIRSLPYLFFKDGLRTLFFRPEMTRAELVTFLETLKEISSLPPEVGDIVDALWQREFTHIQYFAPDDYLISKMAGQNEHQISVDRGRFEEGRIELDSKDTAEVYRSLQGLRYKDPKDDLEFQAETSPMSDSEVGHVQAMMADHRSGAAHFDFLDMAMELLHLEDRREHFAGLLAYLERLHDAWIKNGDFGHILGLVRRLSALIDFLKPIATERAEAASAVLGRFEKEAPFDSILDMARQGKIRDYASLFEYLTWLGPGTINIGSEVLESARDARVRDLAFKFLENVGKIDPMLLTNLAQDKRPLTTRAAISVLGQANDRRFIPFLATFFTYKNKDIKLDAVRALGQITDPLAHRTLLSFLRDDPETGLRTEAARRIRLDLDPALLQAVVNISAEKEFIKREPEERVAILAGIGRSGRDAGYAVIRRFLENKRIFGGKKINALGLSAVSALESLGTYEAKEVLHDLAEKGRKSLRGAGREALDRLAKAAADAERTPA